MNLYEVDYGWTSALVMANTEEKAIELVIEKHSEFNDGLKSLLEEKRSKKINIYIEDAIDVRLLTSLLYNLGEEYVVDFITMNGRRRLW
ncbi:hypothetical protein EDC18_102405 [Natranaerovirga pectinivora]|uniref:Uncharacterized protein n=1 Tax=Natranaerovirga pectinivora TaxID=682400 RepID=A0A4R3MR27_9FIRM|nr:hypothetical protein [Natranaerovirga pectinivora]TCT16386.1 hypothetical protein EDC18_102405 [Natranaerovirga pectinivora]